jgi:hypothetical protein
MAVPSIVTEVPSFPVSPFSPLILTTVQSDQLPLLNVLVAIQTAFGI